VRWHPWADDLKKDVRSQHHLPILSIFASLDLFHGIRAPSVLDRNSSQPVRTECP